MYEREYPVPERDYSRAPLFPLPREGWALLALLAIMLLGAVLRFYGFGFQSLWGGELASWDLGGRDTIPRVVQDGSQPPRYFLILHFARWKFGDSEWALRFPSAVAGWLCIPAIYLLGKKLYSEREGIMAALLVAVLWPAVYFSQEASPYTMLILLSILTSYFWWDLMIGLRYRGELPKREALWYVACAILVQACAAKDVSKVESMVKEEGYTEVIHLISRPEPDQQMISMLQRNFQPVHYERFDGAAVVTYKVGQHPSAGPPQPKPPSGLPREK